MALDLFLAWRMISLCGMQIKVCPLEECKFKLYIHVLLPYYKDI